jgi:CRP/FNR family cyclic AMP-dependent transcriptional regulator
MNRLSLIDKAFLLKKTAPFRGLTLDLLLPIADKLTVATFEKDDEIFNWGEDAHRMYFIVEGSVELSGLDGRICTLKDSEAFFGDEALFNDGKRSYRVRCQTDVVLLTLSQTNLLTIISECPSVALGFLSVYSQQQPQRALEQGVL